MKAVRVWWHCLLRTFSDEHRWLVLDDGHRRHHVCKCGFGFWRSGSGPAVRFGAP